MSPNKIPEGWEDKSLGKLLRTVKGITYKSSDYCEENEGAIFINLKCILKNGGFNKVGLKYYKGLIKQDQVLEPGDIIIAAADLTREGDIIGYPLFVPRLAINRTITMSMDVIKLEPKQNNVDKLFIYYQLCTHSAHIFMRSISAGSTVLHLDLNKVAFLKLRVPKSVKEQQKIASILQSADNAIDKTKELIEKYKKITQGLMHDLFTKGIDENGNIRNQETHKFKDSELGRIPEEWDVKELGEIGKILVSNVDKKTKTGELCVKLCNYMDVYSSEYIDSTLDFMEASATYNEIRKFNLKMGDVIFTKDSETPDDIAVPAIVIENIDNLICGYHLAIIKPKEEIIDGFFVMKCLMLKSVNKHFSKLASGSTRFGLTMGAILTARIPVPSEKEEQERIVNILKSIDKKIWSEQAYLEKLTKIKSGLMQDLLTGKVRVKVAV